MKIEAELLDKVKAATGPDRELDLDLAKALVPDVLVMRQRDDNTGADPYTYWEYTASVDAALALVERVLPLAFVTLEKFAVSDEGKNEWRAWVKLLNESDLSGDGPSVRQSQGFGKSANPP